MLEYSRKIAIYVKIVQSYVASGYKIYNVSSDCQSARSLKRCTLYSIVKQEKERGRESRLLTYTG